MTLTSDFPTFGAVEAAKLAGIEPGATKKKTVQILRIMPPATLSSTLDVRPSASSPAEQLVMGDFDDTTIEYTDLLCRMSDTYGGGGLTWDFAWMATSATSGNVQWEAAIRRLEDDGEDFDSSHTYVFNSVTSTAPGTSGNPKYAAITFTDGADMDNVAAGEFFILRMRRNTADTMVGDAELMGDLFVLC